MVKTNSRPFVKAAQGVLLCRKNCCLQDVVLYTDDTVLLTVRYIFTMETPMVIIESTFFFRLIVRV